MWKINKKDGIMMYVVSKITSGTARMIENEIVGVYSSHWEAKEDFKNRTIAYVSDMLEYVLGVDEIDLAERIGDKSRDEFATDLVNGDEELSEDGIIFNFNMDDGVFQYVESDGSSECKVSIDKFENAIKHVALVDSDNPSQFTIVEVDLELAKSEMERAILEIRKSKPGEWEMSEIIESIGKEVGISEVLYV